MACIGPDGKLGNTARVLLSALGETKTIEELSRLVDVPLFRIRSSLRELESAGLVENLDGGYRITPEGQAKL